MISTRQFRMLYSLYTACSGSSATASINMLATEHDVTTRTVRTDIDALAEDADEYELPDELLDDYADYMGVILYDRNRGMAEKAAEFLENGDNYFFMVGSMHFAGDRGVDDLLAEMGYTVERVA